MGGYADGGAAIPVLSAGYLNRDSSEFVPRNPSISHGLSALRLMGWALAMIAQYAAAVANLHTSGFLDSSYEAWLGGLPRLMAPESTKDAGDETFGTASTRSNIGHRMSLRVEVMHVSFLANMREILRNTAASSP
jgi:hypothetical protein